MRMEKERKSIDSLIKCIEQIEYIKNPTYNNYCIKFLIENNKNSKDKFDEFSQHILRRGIIGVNKIYHYNNPEMELKGEIIFEQKEKNFYKTTVFLRKLIEDYLKIPYLEKIKKFKESNKLY